MDCGPQGAPFYATNLTFLISTRAPPERLTPASPVILHCLIREEVAAWGSLVARGRETPVSPSVTLTKLHRTVGPREDDASLRFLPHQRKVPGAYRNELN